MLIIIEIIENIFSDGVDHMIADVSFVIGIAKSLIFVPHLLSPKDLCGQHVFMRYDVILLNEKVE